jgi:aspartyl-tRNA(Asn)/glutamyl-tRNA(Gln) amidotransferase subunit A
MAPPLIQRSARELRRLLRRREISAVELLDAFAERIATVNEAGGALVALCLERARDEAVAADAAYARGDRRPLLGLPFAAKDMFDTAEVPTAYGSPMFAGHIPDRDAAAVQLLRAAGGILIGKAQTHEWAWGITSVNRRSPSARNAWDPSKVAGGSSGGSAVALALDEVPLALGSDTGGSVRVPAAFNGVAGLKPTWGRIATDGLMPLAPTLDHAGALARTPSDAALLFGVLAGTSRDEQPDLPGEAGLAGVRIAVCADLELVRLAPDVRRAFDAAVDAARGLGVEIVEASFPAAELAVPAFAAIQMSEALRGHRARGLYPARAAEYGDDVRARFERSTQVTAENYLDATRAREEVRSCFARLFAHADLLLTPVSAVPAPALDAERLEHFGATVELRDLVMGFTVPQNLAGVPSCTVRAGFDGDGVPIGVQLTAAWWRDELALWAAGELWSVLAGSDQCPGQNVLA